MSQYWIEMHGGMMIQELCPAYGLPFVAIVGSFSLITLLRMNVIVSRSFLGRVERMLLCKSSVRRWGRTMGFLRAA